MYCPYCGWEMDPVSLRHERYRWALLCQNGVCEVCNVPVVVEVIVDLDPTAILYPPDWEAEDNDEDEAE